ncbi:hypothetical protein [Roseiarcus sp.]|uniref:hypothetical protein n=1 Tax=Roseiarcus sp. TaxID=1969460 RepID=UPI003F947F6B
MRSWPTVSGLACLFALTQASAEEVSVVPQNSVQPHRTKAKIVKPDASKAASPGHIAFSNPYAPPVGAGKLKSTDFTLPERPLPADPQGGFSITAGRESPDAPMTGGLKFRF